MSSGGIHGPGVEAHLISLLERLEEREGPSENGRRKMNMMAEVRTLELWRAVIAECLASVFFVFLVCGSYSPWMGKIVSHEPEARIVVALVCGFSIAILVHSFGQVSGGHLNPAVSIGFAITRRISPLRASMFVLAQLGGGIAGAALLYGATSSGYSGNLGATEISGAISVWQGFGVEFLLTLVVVFVVFSSYNPYRRSSFSAGSPAVITGLAYLAATLVGFPLTGASMNPARSLGPAFVMNKWNAHWVYWVAPLLGGITAALIYEYIFNPHRAARIRKESVDGEPTVEAYPLNMVMRATGSIGLPNQHWLGPQIPMGPGSSVSSNRAPSVTPSLPSIHYPFIQHPNEAVQYGRSYPATSNSSSVGSEEDAYDECSKPPPRYNYNALRTQHYDQYRATSTNTHSPSGYASSMYGPSGNASVYNAPSYKLVSGYAKDEIYCGTKSLYAKSPPLPRTTSLNRSQSVYTRPPPPRSDNYSRNLAQSQNLSAKSPGSFTALLQQQQQQQQQQLQQQQTLENITPYSKNNMRQDTLYVTNKPGLVKPEPVYGVGLSYPKQTDSGDSTYSTYHGSGSYSSSRSSAGPPPLPASRTHRNDLHTPNSVVSGHSGLITPSSMASYHSPNPQY